MNKIIFPYSLCVISFVQYNIHAPTILYDNIICMGVAAVAGAEWRVDLEEQGEEIIVIDGYKLHSGTVCVFYNNAVKGQDTWKQINWRSPNIILTVSIARACCYSLPLRPLFSVVLFMFAICNASAADNTKSTVGGSKRRTRSRRRRRKKQIYYSKKEREEERRRQLHGHISHDPSAYGPRGIFHPYF